MKVIASPLFGDHQASFLIQMSCGKERYFGQKQNLHQHDTSYLPAEDHPVAPGSISLRLWSH